MADTLTYYCFNIFKDLREREHLAWLRGKKVSKEEYKHLDSLVGMFNRLFYL